MVCSVCIALEYAPDDQLRALVVWQAEQIHRLTGGMDLTPPDFTSQPVRVEPSRHAPVGVEAVEAALGADGIYRKPPRVAAPLLIERLAEVGLHLTNGER